jgi:hypothetical protein
MVYHIEYHDDSDLIPLYHLLTMIKKLEIVKFKKLHCEEHWSTTTLTIEYK